jgi:type IX secretion system PorP/SprF family membrane protein
MRFTGKRFMTTLNSQKNVHGMKKLLPLAFLLVSLSVIAQQDPIYSQYMLNPLVINPAYAGLANNFNVTGSYRLQWTGLEGQPNTFNLNGSSSLLQNKAGLGFTFSHDKIGNTKNTEANASFAYKLDLGHDRIVSFGMQAGIINYRIDNAELNIYDEGDEVFMNNEQGTTLNVGAGVIVKGPDFLIGLSVPRMLPTRFTAGDSEFELYNQHYYLFGAYVFYLNEQIKFKPTALVRAVKGVTASTDIGANIIFNSIHTAGVFTRNFKTYGVMLQTLYREKFRFGYVFELPTNKSIGANFTTHEISLGIRLSLLGFHENTIGNF